MSGAAQPPSRRLRTVARLARTSPGYTRVSESILTAIRGNATVVDLLTRLAGDGGRLGGQSHPLKTARAVDGPGADRWPIVLVTLDDPDAGTSPTPEQVAAAIGELDDFQRRLRCFRLVFLVDGDHLAAVRRTGHAVEMLAPPDDLDEGVSLRAHRARRVLSMTDHYQAWLVVDIPLSRRTGLDPAQRDLLEALPAYLADQHDLNDLPGLPGVTDAGGTGRAV